MVSSPSGHSRKRSRARHAVALAALSLLTMTGNADAADRTWFGGSGNWADAERWSPASVPGIADRAILPGGSSLIALNTPHTIGQLRMQGGLLYGAADLTVLGLVEIGGNSVLGGYGSELIANGGLLIDTNSVYSTGVGLGGGTGTTPSGIVNNGIGVISGTWGLYNNSYGRFINGSTGQLSLASDAPFYGGRFVNQGALVKAVGAGGSASSEFRSIFENSGSVAVHQGRLLLSYGGAHSGSFETSADGWLEFGGGWQGPGNVLAAGSRVNGNVRVDALGGRLTVQPGADFDASRTELTGFGYLVAESGALARTGSLRIDAGGFRGAGDLVANGLTSLTTVNSSGSIGGDGGNIVANGGLLIGGDFSRTLGVPGAGVDSGIVNHGAGFWEGSTGFTGWSNGRFVNGASGTLELRSDAYFGSGSFVNQGLLVKTIGAGGDQSSNFTTRLSNTGTIRVEEGVLWAGGNTVGFTNEGEVVVLAGAVFKVSAMAAPFGTFTNLGTMRGNGTLEAANGEGLINRGTLAPGLSVGTLTIDGDLHTDDTGKLQFELSSTASFDRLAITDDASFGGTLEVVNLGYVPVPGDTFTIITHDLRLGGSTFDELLVTGFAAGVSFSVVYNLHDVTLTVSAVPVPEPGTGLLWLAGAAAVAAVVRRQRQLSEES